MPTELDLDIQRINTHLTGAGQMFETRPIARRGVEMPGFVNAPPSLAHYMAHFCALHKRYRVRRRWRPAADLRRGLRRRRQRGARAGDEAGHAARRPRGHRRAQFGELDRRLHGRADGRAAAPPCSTAGGPGDELAYGIDLCECSLVLADRQRAARLEGIEHGAKVVDLRPRRTARHRARTGAGPRATPPPACSTNWGPKTSPRSSITSGSTGSPKGAYSDHLGVTSAVFNYVAAMATIVQLLTEKDLAAHRAAERAGQRAAVPRHRRSAAVPPELRDGPQAGADAQVGRDRGAAAARKGADHLLRGRAADELRDRHPPRPRQVRPQQLQDLRRRRRAAPARARRPRSRTLSPKASRSSATASPKPTGWAAATSTRTTWPSPARPAAPRAPLVDLAILDDDGAPVAAARGGRGGDPLGLQLPRLLEERGSHRRGLYRRRLFPHRRSRLSRRGRLPVHRRPQEGHHHSRRREHRLHRGRAGDLCASRRSPNARCSGCRTNGSAKSPPRSTWSRKGATSRRATCANSSPSGSAKFKIPQYFFEETGSLPRLGTEKIDKRSLRTPLRRSA